MKRGPEGKFQDSLLEIFRSQGAVCQKFNDLYSEGIPDIYVRFPGMLIPRHPSVWIELKAVEEWPKRETSPLPARFKPTQAQIRWMNAFATDRCPCWVIVNTPGGWVAFDHKETESVWKMPISEVKKHLNVEKPTIGRVMRGVYD